MRIIERKNLLYLDTYDTARENPRFYSDVDMNRCIADASLKLNVLFSTATPVLSQTHVFDSAPFIQSLIDEPDAFLETIKKGNDGGICLSLFGKNSFCDALVTMLDRAKEGNFESSGLPYISSLKNGSPDFLDSCAELKEIVSRRGHYLASEKGERKKLDSFLHGLYEIDSYLNKGIIGYVKAEPTSTTLEKYLGKFIEHNKYEESIYFKYIRDAYETAYKNGNANNRAYYYNNAFEFNRNKKALVNIIDVFYNMVLCESNTASIESFNPTFPGLSEKDDFVDNFDNFITEECNHCYSRQSIKTFDLSKMQYKNNRQDFESLSWRDVNYFIEQFDKESILDFKKTQKRSEAILDFCTKTCDEAKRKIHICKTTDGILKASVIISAAAGAASGTVVGGLVGAGIGSAVGGGIGVAVGSSVAKKVSETVVELSLKSALSSDDIDIKEEKKTLKRIEPLKEIATLVNNTACKQTM
ncbi:hypothetical protein FACS18949_01780 [Clostridia bacterium]|nr:hypothetical protein FACS18949_01780 [Clostridia bacterium]